MEPKPTLLLTGGSGMVGRNLRAHPLASKWNMISPSSQDLDLTDADAVKQYFDSTRIDIVVHAAGRVGGIQANMAHPIAFLDENLAIGRNVIMGAYNAGVPKFLNLASTCIYPRAADNPLTEEMILTGELEPTNEGYALAKIMALRLCEYIHRENPDALYKTFIPCNLYGYYDSFNPQKSHLIPAIIHKVHSAKVNNIDSVEIWGDGTARREFMFASDLAEIILTAAQDMKIIPQSMNIGLGYDHTINEYYAAAAEAIGWRGTFTHDLSKPVGMKQKLCSNVHQKELSWTASTSLSEGLAKTYKYYLEKIST